MREQGSSEPEIMSASDVRQNFGSVVNRVARGEGRIVVEKHGSPAVGIVSIEDVRRLRQMDSRLAERRAFVDSVRRRFQDADPDEIEREITKAFEEIREEDHARKPDVQALVR